MPPVPGEECLLTVFADVHYYFSPPTPQPSHHRFEKASYLYLYHDANQQKARVEIANNPGAREQDAFAGSLGTVHLRNSDTFPTHFTITVDGHRQSIPGSGPSQNPNDKDWCLTYFDSARGPSFLRLHTIDLYLWTAEDATSLVSKMQQLLMPSQLDISPSIQPAGHDDLASPVVQQLEQVAISDPAYHSMQKGSQQAEVTRSPPPNSMPMSHMAASTTQNTSKPATPKGEAHTQTPPISQEPPANYAPLPYNPAAPAAPEPIKYREKTPPPPDNMAGPGLSTAGAVHHGMSFAPPPQPEYHPSNQGHANVNQGYTPGSTNAGPGGPPNTFGRPSSVASYTQHHNPPGSLSFAPPPVTAASPQPITSNSRSMSFSPPPQDPNAHLYRPQSFGQSPPNSPYNPAHHIQQPYMERRDSQLSMQQPIGGSVQQPMGGYANHSYNQHQPETGNPYDLHHQVYRPTEAEAMHSKLAAHETEQLGARKQGAITGNVIRAEKSVNRFLRRLEKRI